MKHLLMIAALALPVAATALPSPIEEFEPTVTKASFAPQLAEAPQLPFAGSEPAQFCGQLIDPLPDVLTLHLDDEAASKLAFCIIE